MLRPRESGAYSKCYCKCNYVFTSFTDNCSAWNCNSAKNVSFPLTAKEIQGKIDVQEARVTQEPKQNAYN